MYEKKQKHNGKDICRGFAHIVRLNRISESEKIEALNFNWNYSNQSYKIKNKHDLFI
jgi:hypothetical protein